MIKLLVEPGNLKVQSSGSQTQVHDASKKFSFTYEDHKEMRKIIM